MPLVLLLAGTSSAGLIPSVLADSNYATVLPYTTGTPLTPSAPATTGTRYGRIIRLQHSGSANGTLLATYEAFPQDLSIYKSTDDGLTWARIATVPETQFPGYQFKKQPDLFEVPAPMGNLPAGTVLLAANSVTGSGDHQLEIYGSLDQGVTWAYRGMADNTSTLPGGLWEPRLDVTSSGQLICYYSDERFQPTYNQLLGERVSPDGGLTWGAEMQVCAIPDGVQRPGMAVTAHLPNGQYVMSFETPPNPSGQVHIKFSNDGITWGTGATDYGTAVQTASGSFLGGTPYIAWIPAGGSNGTLVLSAHALADSTCTNREIFVNAKLGQGNWTLMPAPVQWQGGSNNLAGWSQAMIPTADGLGVIQLASSNGTAGTDQMLFGREQLILPGTAYLFTNQNSGLAVSIPGDSTVNGTGLQQRTVDSGSAQQWTFTIAGNNVWMVTNPGNQLVWADEGASSTTGTSIDEATNASLAPQQWKLRPVGDGSWKFLNASSGLVMSVANASQDTGATLVQATSGTRTEQNWLPLEPTITSTTSFFASETALGSGVYYLAFSNGNYFGYYSYLADPSYIYHFDLGYEYVFDANDGKSGVYLYDFASSDFFYTSPAFPFPYLYDFSLNSVLYYYPDPNNPGHYNTSGVRCFYDFNTGTIITK